MGSHVVYKAELHISFAKFLCYNSDVIVGEREGRGGSVGLREFEPLFRGLQLERCSLRRNPVTGEVGWYGPRGYAFKIAGQFWLDSHVSDVWYRRAPQKSAEQLKARYAGRYQVFLERTNGNTELALELLVEDVGSYKGELEVPESFVGKWLVISPNLDGSATLLGAGVQGKVALMVKDEIKAWYAHDRFKYLPDIAPESETVTSCIYDPSVGFVRWIQYYAEAVPGSCRIELVGVKEVRPELFVPSPVEKKVQRPVLWSSEKRQRVAAEGVQGGDGVETAGKLS